LFAGPRSKVQASSDALVKIQEYWYWQVMSTSLLLLGKGDSSILTSHLCLTSWPCYWASAMQEAIQSATGRVPPRPSLPQSDRY
jgi:hypothetical protein